MPDGVLLRDNNLERDSQQMAIGAESVSDCPRTRNLLSLPIWFWMDLELTNKIASFNPAIQ